MVRQPQPAEVVGVVTDSASSLEPELSARLGVAVVPMRLILDGTELDDSSTEAAELLARAEQVSTAGPPPGAFAEAVQRTDDGQGVIVLTCAQRFSSTYDAARLGASLAGCDVAVLDTGTAAAAEGLVVQAAAAVARRGSALPEVVRHADQVRSLVRLVAQLGDLRPLARRGRLPAAVASLAGRAGVHPVFELASGRIRLLRPASGERAALAVVLDAWRRSRRRGHRLHVAGIGTGAATCDLLETVIGEWPPESCTMSSWSPVMTVHTGLDVSGLAWWWEPPGESDGANTPS